MCSDPDPIDCSVPQSKMHDLIRGLIIPGRYSFSEGDKCLPLGSVLDMQASNHLHTHYKHAAIDLKISSFVPAKLSCFKCLAA